MKTVINHVNFHDTPHPSQLFIFSDHLSTLCLIADSGSDRAVGGLSYLISQTRLHCDHICKHINGQDSARAVKLTTMQPADERGLSWRSPFQNNSRVNYMNIKTRFLCSYLPSKDPFLMNEEIGIITTEQLRFL